MPQVTAMTLIIRRWCTMVDEVLLSEGRSGDPPLRRVAALAVIENPYAGRDVEDLSPLIQDSAELGRFLAEKGVAALQPYAAQSYGKAAMVGLHGQQEHANALITTVFAEPVRAAIGGGKAWISSYTKRTSPGSSIDVPLAHKDALYVRSHYDGMTVQLADAPMPDEICVIVCLANRGRIGARVGGLKAEEISGTDGLR